MQTSRSVFGEVNARVFTCTYNSCRYTIEMDASATPSGCTNFKLRRVTRLVSRHYDTALAPSGLKTTQYSLLSIVLAQGPLRPSDLAGAMDLDASTLTRNLKPLVEAGWLTLGEGADARSRLVAITPSGRARRGDARLLWRGAQQQLNQMLGASQVATLHALLDQSLSALQHDRMHDRTEVTP